MFWESQILYMFTGAILTGYGAIEVKLMPLKSHNLHYYGLWRWWLSYLLSTWYMVYHEPLIYILLLKKSQGMRLQC